MLSILYGILPAFEARLQSFNGRTCSTDFSVLNCNKLVQIADDADMVQNDKSAEEQKPLFRVRPTKQVRRDADDLFQTEREKLWVISQLKLLSHWPLDQQQQAQLGSDLDFSKVHHRNETFYELRLDDEHLHQKNLRLFFWIHDEKRTLWVLHGYWKKTNRLDDAVKTLVARRIKNLKGGIQDGSIK